VFPDLAGSVFSNLAGFNTADRHMHGRSVHQDGSARSETVIGSIDSSRALLNDTIHWKKMKGNYISDEGMMVRFDLRNGRMTYIINNNFRMVGNHLKDTLTDLAEPARKFRMRIEGRDTLVDAFSPGQNFLFRKYVPGKVYTDDELTKYTGTYYSDELDCSYSIILKEHQLYLTNPKYNDARITLNGDNQMNCGFWWMNNMILQRGRKGEVIGFEVNNGRVLHLKFRKID
jgi:hypothetical protein